MWFIMAWQRISPEVTVKSFEKCCLSNAMDKSADDIFWNGSEEDGNVRSECEADEGTNCDNEDSDTDW